MAVALPSSRIVCRAGWGILLLALLQVVWLAGTLETGVDTLAQDLHDVSWGRLGSDLERFERFTQAESNRFWIDLVSADIAAEPDSVDRLLEGAFLLSAIPPGKDELFALFEQWWSDAELRPVQKCWLDRACQLAPDDPRVWRARFQIDQRFSETTKPPLTELNAIALLRQWQQAALADSGNALYDYLFQVNRKQIRNLSLDPKAQSEDSQELASLSDWFESRQSDLDRLPFLDGPVPN